VKILNRQCEKCLWHCNLASQLFVVHATLAFKNFTFWK